MIRVVGSDSALKSLILTSCDLTWIWQAMTCDSTLTRLKKLFAGLRKKGDKQPIVWTN